MKYFMSLLLILCFNIILVAQDSQWELTQEELQSLVSSSDIIVLGTIQDNKIQVIDVLFGSSKLPKAVVNNKKVRVIEVDQKELQDTDRSSILFLKKTKEDYSHAELVSESGIMKSDFFLLSRVRTAIMKYRVAQAELITVAEIESIDEEEQENETKVLVHCKSKKVFKGQTKEKFTFSYTITKTNHFSSVLIIPSLTYILFLKNNTLVSPFDGACLEKADVIKEIQLAIQLDNPFESNAGRTINGMFLFAQASKEKFMENENVRLDIIVQNDSENFQTIFNRTNSVFLVAHVLDSNGNILEPKINDSPKMPVAERKFFMKLLPHGYISLPAYLLNKYYQLKPDTYTIYMEYTLPEEYNGKQWNKNGWVGTIMSKKLEIVIEKKDK